jgi:TolB-like protein/DNA-binding winged helix-turn-helix (wHTH) protein
MDRQVNYLYEFGPFRLDPKEHTLLRDGRPIPLRPKVFDLLLVLIENRGHLVDKEQLMSVVWQEQFVEEGNINKNVSMLRRALGEGDNGQQFIETVPKRGYRFIGDVRKVKTDEAPAAQNIPAKTQAFSRRWIPVLIIPALLIAAVAYFFIFKRRVARTPIITSIVVLPLQNLSGDPAQEYFADGMTDALIGDLAQLGALRVISRTSAMHYKGTNKSLPEIARELKVDAVVEGTVQRSGDRVHVRAQLIHAPSDSHLWTAEYDRDLRDAFDLQSEVARAIAARCASRSRRPNNDYSFQRESLLVKLSTITCKVATS